MSNNPSPEIPKLKPSHSFFGSGPCRKFPGWKPDLLSTALLSRSHRSLQGQGRILEVIDLVRDVLGIPKDYKVLILVGSATAAVESALWNLLGATSLTTLVQDIFSARWAQDISEQLRLQQLDIRRAPVGELPHLRDIPDHHDILVNWNGSTSGVAIPHSTWINSNRSGLVLCDATSAAFCMALPWEKLDATAFSWQKGLGGEAGHGVLVLSPKAIERLNTHTPTWPVPYLLKLTRQGKFFEELSTGLLINTPSLLSIEDYKHALIWAKNIGGLPVLLKRCQQNLAVIQQWVKKHSWVDFLCQDPTTQSTSTVCLKLDLHSVQTEEQAWAKATRIQQLLEQHNVAYDIKNHAASAPSLRIWTGPTMESADIAVLCEWITWAYQSIR